MILREQFFISRPLTLFARHTQTDTDILPLRLAEAKTVNRFAIIITLMPERHLKLLPGQVAQAKNLYCLCGSAAKIFKTFSILLNKFWEVDSR